MRALLSINHISWWSGQGEVSWLEFSVVLAQLGLYLHYSLHHRIVICWHHEICDNHRSSRKTGFLLKQYVTVSSHMHASLQFRGKPTNQADCSLLWALNRISAKPKNGVSVYETEWQQDATYRQESGLTGLWIPLNEPHVYAELSAELDVTSPHQPLIFSLSFWDHANW